jgi:hypothetical protein
MELLFDSRRYNPVQVDEYFGDSRLPITLEFGETFGKHLKVKGFLTLE